MPIKKAVAGDIATALERSERPHADAVVEARTLLRRLNDDLDDVCALYEIPRWETNVQWEELDDDERAAYQERANR